MTWAFANWHDFFAMGGYAFYVWLAVVLTVLPLVGIICHNLLQHRAILRTIARQQAREQRIKAAKQQKESS